MLTPLHDRQSVAGAKFETLDHSEVAITFGNDPDALKAAYESAALYDRSHWGLIHVLGDDRIRYLHNQSTNDFQSRHSGEFFETVFVTSTARTIDLASVFVLDDRILLLSSPNRRQKLLDWLDRYIFPADRVTLQDQRSTTAQFNLIGPESARVLQSLTTTDLSDLGEHTHILLDLDQLTVRVSGASGLALPGYTLVVEAENAAAIWEALATAGAVPTGHQVWEQIRIRQGRPYPDRELTEDYNPLEAGLWQTISFSKGCYIGQETIARLNTYQGVKQQLWGIRLPSAAEAGTVIMLGEEKIGKLTSITQTETGWLGLAYIRSKAGGVGLMVQVGAVKGEVIDVPYLQHGEAAPNAGAV
jgi:tRNA-modifying protein YgfZ